MAKKKKMLLPYNPKDKKAQKYIVFKDGSTRVFPKDQIHKFVAGATGKEAVSAGFVSKTKKGLKTYGWSDSLQKKARGGDAKRLAKHFAQR